MKVTVTLPEGITFEKEYKQGITPEDIIQSLKEKPVFRILACRINNHSERLDYSIQNDSHVDLLDMRDSYANMSYQMSLTLLYITAVHELYGKEAHTLIANSLSKGLFTKIKISPLTDEVCNAIENKMKGMVEEKLPIREQWRDREDILHDPKVKEDSDDMRLFRSAYDLRGGWICTLNHQKALFYQHLLPDTSYLNLFEIRRYRNGVLLRFPHPSDPDTVPVYAEQKKLYEAFSEETHWDKLLGIDEASDLNEIVRSGNYKETILLSEALHEKRIAEIAEMIHKQNKRIVLIAGPSSSGKTSFAKRLCIQLRVIGLKPLYLGTDDYFVNRDQLIPEPDGSLNFEDLSALDVNLFTEQMNALLAGKKVDLPEFDFITGKKIYGRRITSIEPHQPIVIEGIHGLNPALTKGIDDKEKFRIYISPLTQLNIDRHHRVPTTDARMLRRLVRDYRTRNRSASETIDDWPSVRRGEEKNIFPFNDQADVFFNSQCQYELAVLKKYAEPLLKAIDIDAPEYCEAQRMLQFLEFFVSIPDDSAIPNNSIIREFIGGSVLVH